MATFLDQTTHAGKRREISRLCKERLPILVLLAITIWTAHFSQSFHFGLYEDDWAFIGQPIDWTWNQFLDWLSICFTAWPQGRPVGFATVATLAYMGNRIGGLEFLYFMACAFHTLNAFLFYSIVRRKLSPAPATCAALAFSLFPSNTAIPLLTNSFFGSLTVFFLLLATWLYLKGWRLAAYLVSAGSLLTYESAFLPFFAVPLLQTKPMRQIRRELLKHAAILLAIGGFLFWFRLHIGENKTADVVHDGLFGTLVRIATAMYVGPTTTLRLFFTRIVTLFREGDREVWLVVAMMAVVLSIALFFQKMYSSDRLETWPFSRRIGRFRFQMTVTIDESSAGALRVSACGLVMLVLAYGLAISRFYYPPNIEAGRLTGMHLSASVGAALLFGALSSLLFDVSQSHRKRILAVLALSCYLSGLAGFHYRVQQDFRRAWNIERAFWNSVLRECPDLTDGTIILYEGGYVSPRYVLANSWADPYILGEIYSFPSDWHRPPQLFPASSLWTADVTQVRGALFWRAPNPWPDQILTNDKVIVLRGDPDGLKRITGTVEINSQKFSLKPIEPSRLSSYKPRPVRYYLFRR
jgi:hypothetical protein